MARRSNRQKLIGWGVFAAMVVVIVAIFLVTRMLGGGTPREAATASIAEASPAAVVAAPPSAADASPAPGISSVANASSASGIAPSAQSAPSLPSSSAPAVQVVDAGTMSQQSRRSFLLTLIQQGVFTGVQALDTPPRVGVTALFKGLSPDLQQQFIAVVYAYINNGTAGTQPLQLIDATNGAQVGSYSSTGGLKLSEG